MAKGQVIGISVWLALLVGLFVLNWLDLQLKRGFSEVPEDRKMLYSFAGLITLAAYIAIWAWAIINIVRLG